MHNFSKTTVEKRALYVKAVALWCIDCDLTSPHVITKPILDAFQRYLKNCVSSSHGSPSRTTSPSVPPPRSNFPSNPRRCLSRSYLPMKSNESCSSPTLPHRSAFAIEPSSKFCTQPVFDAPKSVRCTSTTSTSIVKSSSLGKAKANEIATSPSACEHFSGSPATSSKLVNNWPSIPKNARSFSLCSARPSTPIHLPSTGVDTSRAPTLKSPVPVTSSDTPWPR